MSRNAGAPLVNLGVQGHTVGTMSPELETLLSCCTPPWYRFSTVGIGSFDARGQALMRQGDSRTRRNRRAIVGVLLLASLLFLAAAPSSTVASPTTIRPSTAPAGSWTSALRLHSAVTATPIRDASTAASSPILVVDNGGDYSNPEPAENAQHILEHLGYTVATASRLPRTLTGYKAIWVIGTNALSSTEQATLEGFVTAGGGLYLTGERPCCETENQADQAIAQQLVRNPLIRVGDGSDVENVSIAHNRFNPYAVDGVTQVPDRLTTWQPSAPGVMLGLNYDNAVTFGEQGGFQRPTGAAWGSSELRGGRGGLVLMMDINWLESGYGNLPEAERFVLDIERFLTGGPPPSTGRYVALGDSYSSGVGNPPYIPENPDHGCLRSEKSAYPDILAKDLGLSAGNYAFNFIACSGATSDDMRANQLAELGPSTKLVTVTAGGDDVHFADVLKDCVEHSLKSITKTSCGTGSAPEIHDAVANIQALESKLESFYAAIKARAPSARIFVLGYPYIFPSGTGFLCNGLNSASVTWLYHRQVELDEVITRAAAAKGVTYVNPNALGAPYSFVEDNQHKSHSICSSASWFVGANPFTGGPLANPPTAFHPDREGQKRMAEALIAAGATKAKVNSAIGQPLSSPLAAGPSRASARSVSRAAVVPHARRRPASRRANAGAVPLAESGTASIGGRVTGPIGEALSSVTVYLQSAELGYYGSTTTEAKGKYSFTGLPAGTYKVEFYRYGYEPQWYSGKSTGATATPIVLKAGTAKVSINGALPIDGSITGTVTATGGTALANVNVSVTTSEGSYVASGETGLAGEYTVPNLVAGSYKVEFTSSGAGAFYETQWYQAQPSLQTANAVTLTSSDNAKGINATLVPDGTISGIVTATDHTPLAGVEVIARTAQSQQIAYTSENGEYTIYGIQTGTYTIEFQPVDKPYATQWYSDKRRQNEATAIVVQPSANIPEIDGTLEPDATITGKVTSPTGRPLEGVRVFATAVGGESSGNAVTAAGGVYTLEDLPPGEYTVNFQAQGKYFAQQWFNDAAIEGAATVLTLAPGELRSAINATLESTAATIEGHVKDALGPVAGVNVLVLAGGGKTVASTTTNAEGLYTVEGLQEGSYTVEFEAEETPDLSQYFEGATNAAEAKTIALTRTATVLAEATLLRGATITGTVTENGNPAPDTSVDVLTQSGAFVRSAVTAEDGAYSITGLTAGSYKLKFEPTTGNATSQYYAGQATLENAQTLELSAGEERTASAELTSGAEIQGTITTAAGGTPLENVRVLATNSEGAVVATASSGTEGTYTLAGLNTGSYTIQFEPESSSYLSEYYPAARSLEAATPVAVAAGHTVEAINAALPASATMSGTVSGSGETPIAGAEVTAVSSEGFARTTTTSSGGAYELNGLPPGRYTVHFEPPADTTVALAQYFRGATAPQNAEVVDLESGQTKTGINASLVAASSIHGTVTEAGTANDLAGVEVIATASEGAATAQATTNSNGEYTISGLPAESYTVQFDEPAHYVSQYYKNATVPEGAEPVTLTTGAATEGINASLTPGATISGDVSQEDNTPAAAVTVTALSTDGSTSGTATTDQNGAYRITGLPAGSYTVEFEPTTQNYVSQYYPSGSSAKGATAVTLATGQAIEGIGVTLQTGATIAGTIEQTGTKRPLAGINVYAYQTCASISVGTTNTEGDYTVQGLAAGSYHVVINPDGGTLNVAVHNGAVTLSKAGTQPGINAALTEEPETSSATPFSCEEPSTAAPPEFGHCTTVAPQKENGKTVYHGWFTTSTCTTRGATQTGKYEWHAGVTKTGFSDAIKIKTTAVFETVHKQKITCTGESNAGNISGPKEVTGVTLTLTGCETASKKCTTAGLGEGELESKPLEGVLGLEKTTIKEGKETRYVALDLYPVGHQGPFLEYACAGGPAIVITGSVIGPVPADKAFTTGTVTHTETAGKQKPERFEGGEQDVLENSLSEQLGLKLTATQTNEEAFEINAFA